MCYLFDFRSSVRCSRGAVKELLGLRQVWRFMLPGKAMPCFPEGDAQLAQNPVTNSNSRHIDVCHFL